MLHNNLCTSRLNLLRFQKLRIFQNFDLFYTNTTTFSLKFAQISRNFGATPKKLTIFVKNFKLKCLSIYFLFSIFPIIFQYSENSSDFFVSLSMLYSRMTEIGVCVAIVSRELIMHPTRKHYYNISNNYILRQHWQSEQIPIIHFEILQISKNLSHPEKYLF